MQRTISPPGRLKAASDMPRACLEAGTVVMNWWWLRQLPKGDAHPVMVIPGFAGSDTYNKPLIHFLQRQGYHAVGWKQGVNLGHSHLDIDRLSDRVDKLYSREGRPISLIGHSLGGIFARETARRYPDKVRLVMSLGSPVARARNAASNLNVLYRQMNTTPAEIEESDWHLPPPVPTTALYSRFDGVLDWRVCLQASGHAQTENVEVMGSHNGLTLNAMSWIVIADRLAQPEWHWRPFRHNRLWRLLFKKPAWRPESSGSKSAYNAHYDDQTASQQASA